MLYTELVRTMDNHADFRSFQLRFSEYSFTCNQRLCYICEAFIIMSVCYINNESLDFLGVQ